MRFLADMGVSLTTVAALRRADHDAVHLRDEGRIGLPGSGIVAKAMEPDCAHVRSGFQRHFGDRAQRDSERHHFRLRNQTPAAVNPRLFRVIDDCAAELASGAIVIVEDSGFRVRRLPIQP